MFKKAKVFLLKKRKRNQELTNKDKAQNQVNTRARIPIEHACNWQNEEV